MFFGKVVAHGSVLAWWTRIKSKEGLFGLGIFAKHVLFGIVFSCVHSLSPAVCESLLRQICGFFCDCSQPSKICDSPAICHAVAISWPWFGLSCSCGRTGQGGMERCGVMWCVVVVRGRRSDERTVVIARCRFAESGGGSSDEVETHVSNSVRVFLQIIKRRGYLFFVRFLTLKSAVGVNMALSGISEGCQSGSRHWLRFVVR